MQLASGADGTIATSRVISRTHNDDKSVFNPDYSILSDPTHHMRALASEKKIAHLILKEEFGDDQNRGTSDINECNFPVLRTQAEIKEAKPAFGFREPVLTFESWKKQNWNDLPSFITAYKSAFDQYQEACRIIPQTPVNVHDLFIESKDNSKKIMSTVLEHWDIPFNDDIIDKPRAFAEKFMFHNENEKDIYLGNRNGLFTSLLNGEIRRDRPATKLVSDNEKNIIIEELSLEYGQVYRDCIQKCNLMKAEK